MRTLRRAGIAFLLIIACIGLLPVGSSHAASGGKPACGGGQQAVQSQLGGWICVAVATPGSPGGSHSGGGGGGGTGSAGGQPAMCTDAHSGEEAPCTTPGAGAWFDEGFEGNGCIAFMLQPQPPAGDPMWHGHDASEGNVWGCDTDFANAGNTFFVPNRQAPALVDPAVLARRALGQLKLERANAEIAPGPDFHTYVHIENWMWVPADQWRTLTLTVSQGPTSVTVNAGPVRAEWDMGPKTVTCPDAGRVWRKGMSDKAKTSCSFAYDSLENPEGDKYTVSANLVYGATWTCAGACLTPSGDLGEIAAPAGQATTIEVRQRQTVVTE